jgi:hypothetical protein
MYQLDTFDRFRDDEDVVDHNNVHKRILLPLKGSGR